MESRNGLGHTRPHLLDLFCGAGGAARGYQDAGFRVTGVDILPQPRYCGDVFVQGDALEYLSVYGHTFDVIHASPPCQGYSAMRHLPWLRDRTYPLLLPAVLQACQVLGTPYVIENVERAPLDGMVLCGLQVGLALYRHRRFASNILLMTPPHPVHTHVICHGRRNLAQRYRRGGHRDVTGVLGAISDEEAMGIDWMTREELSQAIPPAYTAWIGAQLLQRCVAKQTTEETTDGR